MPPRKPSPIGVHVPVAGGLASGGFAYARDVGAEAVQVFLSNPRGWARTSGDPRQDDEFRTGCATAKMPTFVHAAYLVNLGSPTPATLENSVLSLRHALMRGCAIGARGVVVHAGSAVTASSKPAAMAQLREHVLPLLDEIPDDGPDLLIEATAGSGQSLAATVEELGPYMRALDDHPRLGVCLDTCHAFAAGHDLATPGGVRSTLNALVRAVGRGRLKLIHVNDSKDARGSNRDNHERIGKGRIGIEPFAELFRHPATRGVPLLLETPGKAPEHREDLALMKTLRDR
ncbi:MAG: deoxyribonuclease [Actinomycetota bacterium]|jgi:deoxyribonuclease IV|nr:deoxyribonuclease [Actinomycetota bacterium]